MLDRLKISQKMLLGFGLVLGLFGLMSLMSLLSLGRIKEKAGFVRQKAFREVMAVVSVINLSEKAQADMFVAAESASSAYLDRAEKARTDMAREIEALKKELPEDSAVRAKLAPFETAFAKSYGLGSTMVGYAVMQDVLETVSAQTAFKESLKTLKTREAALKDASFQALGGSLENIEGLSRGTGRGILVLAALGALLGCSAPPTPSAAPTATTTATAEPERLASPSASPTEPGPGTFPGNATLLRNRSLIQDPIGYNLQANSDYPGSSTGRKVWWKLDSGR
ncbi:MAG: hypothetical protein P8Y39_11540 [Nitrospirota bacterium]